MKKTLLFFLVFQLAASSVFAASKKEATPSAKPTTSQEKTIETKIKELKERVATRVAQLREEKKKAILGIVKEGTKESLTLTTKTGEITVKLDEEGKIIHLLDGRRVAAKISDIDIGERILAQGTLDEEGTLLAAKIIAKRPIVNLNGLVAEVDTKEGTITVATKTGEKKVVDIETTTKISVWEKGLPAGGQGKGLIKGGFSKIKVSDRVHVQGFEKMEDKTKLFQATRILVLPGLALGITGEKPASPTALPKTSPTATE